jgi:hypothetical protein
MFQQRVKTKKKQYLLLVVALQFVVHIKHYLSELLAAGAAEITVRFPGVKYIREMNVGVGPVQHLYELLQCRFVLFFLYI